MTLRTGLRTSSNRAAVRLLQHRATAAAELTRWLEFCERYLFHTPAPGEGLTVLAGALSPQPDFQG